MQLFGFGNRVENGGLFVITAVLIILPSVNQWEDSSIHNWVFEPKMCVHVGIATGILVCGPFSGHIRIFTHRGHKKRDRRSF